MHVMNGQIVSMSTIAKALAVSPAVVKAWDRQDPRPSEMDGIYINVPEVREPLLPFQIHSGATLDVSGTEPVAHYTAVDVDLEIARATALQLASAKRDSDIDTLAVEYMGHTFDADDKSQERMSRAADFLEEASKVQQNLTVGWSVGEDTIELSPAQLKDLRMTSGLAWQKVWVWFGQQKTLIAAATTVQELRDIVTAWGSE